MVLRFSATRIFRFSKLQGHVAQNGILPWSINNYRLATPAGFLSINRTVSTNARKPDMTTVIVESDIKDPLERFREHFTKGTLTRPLVVSCLEDAVRLNQPGSRMGEAAIMWLWRSYDSIEYPEDADLLNPVAVLLVREGKEELLWNWMAQETTKPADESLKSGSYDKRYEWRSAALRALVEAKVHFATNHSLDAALETLFRGTKVPYFLVVDPAANFCHKMLCLTSDQSPTRTYDDMRNGLMFTNTSSLLWDALYTEIGKRPGAFAEQNQATMRLHHPRHPDPWPLLECWRRAEVDEGHTFRRVESRTASIALVENSRDLRLVLKHLGHHEEAAWVKKFTAEMFPRDGGLTGKSRRERHTVDGKPLPSL
jgi:hypothetical protein